MFQKSALSGVATYLPMDRRYRRGSAIRRWPALPVVQADGLEAISRARNLSRDLS